MMFTGQIYHPMVAQSGYFADSVSQYNPNNVARVFQQADQIELNDPQIPDDYKLWKLGLIDLRNTISNDRMMSKWQKAVMGSGLVSDNEVKVAYEQQARTADISYVYVPYASVQNESLNITDADRNEYFNKHREAYKRQDEARIKYGYFKLNPSKQDSMDTRSDLEKLKREFLSSEEVFAFAFSNSDGEGIDTTSKPLALLPSELAGLNDRTDTIIGPLLTADGYKMMRLVKVEKDSAIASIDIRHILIRPLSPSPADSINALTSANQIKDQIIADKTQFETLAKTKSADENTRDQGGKVGWVREDALGPQSTADMQGANVGDVFVTQAQDGYHVIEVMDRTNTLYAYAEISRLITPGTETNDSVFQRASTYLGDVLSGTDMDEAAAKFPDLRMSVSGNIGAGTYDLLGIAGARPVVTWAFNASTGVVSEKVLEADDAYVIARVEYKGDKGYSTVEDLKDDASFQAAVANYVKAKQIKAKLGSGADLPGIASSYGPGAISGSARGLTFASNDVKDLGSEPKIVGRAFGLAPGKVSKPIAGNVGVFVIKVENRTEPGAMEEFAKQFQKQMLTKTKGEAIVNAVFQGMIDIADVRDFRFRNNQ